MRYLAFGSLLLVAGCAYSTEPTMHRVRDYDTKQVVPGLAVLSSGDPCSGPIQSVLLQQRYAYGQFEPLSHSSGPGTCQTVVDSILPAAATATSGALYPAAKTVISNVGNSRSSARGGTANATGGIVQARLSNTQRQGQQQGQQQHLNASASAETGAITVNPPPSVPAAPQVTPAYDPHVTVSQ